MAPFSITLNDLYPHFQGYAILWRWISQKRYDIHSFNDTPPCSDFMDMLWHLISYYYYLTVSFWMTLSDLEWLNKILDVTNCRTVSLRQLRFLSNDTKNCMVSLQWLSLLLHEFTWRLNADGPLVWHFSCMWWTLFPILIAELNPIFIDF